MPAGKTAMTMGDKRPGVAARTARPVLRLALLLVLLLVLAALAAWWHLGRSLPLLEGELGMAGLSAPARISRDSNGVVTIEARNRADAARALGFVHGQERLFQMDTLRRLAAGELSELMGDTTADIDRRVRLHRFRARARAMVAAMPAEDRALLDSYVAGVNQGRAALGALPYEYLLLRARPEAWTAEDSILAVFAMYLNLQPATPQRELDRARAAKALGDGMAAFLYPVTTGLDAPIDGSRLSPPPLPAAVMPMEMPPATATPLDVRLPEAVGSNNWAVGGALTASGAALVANDMHLGLDVPSIWFRARLIVGSRAGDDAFMDASGVTLPGTPFIVTGSNGHISWGYTNSYIDTSDAVVIEWVDKTAGLYRVPGGTARIESLDERLCIRDACEILTVRETIWGPIVAEDAFGRSIAMRWTAHQPDAVRLGRALALERARSVAEAIAIAQTSAIPQQNFTVGDALGNIGWTIIGQVPKRYGFDGQQAVSFADGSKGWDGLLTPAETPAVINPPGHRIWTANSRVMGGEAFERLGDGGYDSGARAGRIRDLLMARDRFGPADFLVIQLDDKSTRNMFWQQLMLAELRKRPAQARLSAMVAPVEAWGEHARPDSAGYRMVQLFRQTLVEGLYEAWLGQPPEGSGRKTWAPSQAEGPARRLLTERPAALVPPGHAGWDDFVEKALLKVAEDIAREAGGDPARYRWGDVAVAGVSHPLARAIRPLGWLVNPKEREVPGDRTTVRAQAPGFGASERFTVSPGREAEGLFHMPGGQASNPRAPYYLAGHADWVEGRATPFLPGPARWTLDLKPAAGAPAPRG